MAKPASTKKSKKISIELWIAIGNLLLTAIVGIGIAIFLQAREQRFQAELQNKNEEFQKQIIEIQNQTQFAHIDISHQRRSGGHFIEIKNVGPAIAKNLKIAICIESLNPIWIEQITDISQFEFGKFTNPSFNLSREDTKSSCNFAFGDDTNNASILTIDLLPSNESIGLTVSLAKGIQLEEIQTSVNTFILIPTEIATKISPTEVKLDIYALTDALDDKFTIATFKTAASCENCIVESDSKIVPLISRTGGGSLYLTSPILGESSKYISVNFETTTSHRVPIGVKLPSINLYLLESVEYYLDNPIVYYSEIYDTYFDSIKP